MLPRNFLLIVSFSIIPIAIAGPHDGPIQSHRSDEKFYIPDNEYLSDFDYVNDFMILLLVDLN